MAVLRCDERRSPRCARRASIRVQPRDLRRSARRQRARAADLVLEGRERIAGVVIGPPEVQLAVRGNRVRHEERKGVDGDAAVLVVIAPLSRDARGLVLSGTVNPAPTARLPQEIDAVRAECATSRLKFCPFRDEPVQTAAPHWPSPQLFTLIVTVSDSPDSTSSAFVTEIDDPVNAIFASSGFFTSTIVNPVTKRLNECIEELPLFVIFALTVNGAVVCGCPPGAGGTRHLQAVHLLAIVGDAGQCECCEHDSNQAADKLVLRVHAYFPRLVPGHCVPALRVVDSVAGQSSRRGRICTLVWVAVKISVSHPNFAAIAVDANHIASELRRPRLSERSNDLRRWRRRKCRDLVARNPRPLLQQGDLWSARDALVGQPRRGTGAARHFRNGAASCSR